MDAVQRLLMMLALAGVAAACARPPDGAQGGDPQAAPPGAAVTSVTADARGFTPSSIDIARGGSGRLVFTRTTAATCATAVVFPQLGIERELPVGQPVAVEVPTDVARTLTFQCGMGMYRSKVLVR